MVEFCVFIHFNSFFFSFFFFFFDTDDTGHAGNLESHKEIVMAPVFAELKVQSGILHLVQIRTLIYQN